MYRKVERTDKQDLVAALLPQVFQWARAVDPSSAADQWRVAGRVGRPGRRSTIAGIQLDNSDVITFHSYAKPAEIRGAGSPNSPHCDGRSSAPSTWRGTLGSSVEGILPIAKRHNVGAFNWGLVAGKTQTYLPWDSWDHPYPAPKMWFSDLLRPDGRPYGTAKSARYGG